MAEVTFKVKNEAIQAHSIIVSAVSPVFSAMFQQDFKEKNTRVVIIEGDYMGKKKETMTVDFKR